MARRSKLVDISVSRRVLWVGGDAYPLHNIARARRFELIPPGRSRVVLRFVRQMAGLLFLAVLLNLLTKGSPHASSAAVPAAALITLSLISLYRMVRRLRLRPLYELVIETSSSSDTAVVSRDLGQINQLIGLIMEAIDNPHAEFALQVENVRIGDRINQYDNRNTRKRARS
ncbi:DUF6232 family protein [Kitasatospora sp. NPDC097643]|uniref:DUF6232 family protein n=1 Tax=Kitasatospora sp. NPDC097643 TaxID=3157230 RepID=UPI0033259B0C